LRLFEDLDGIGKKKTEFLMTRHLSKGTRIDKREKKRGSREARKFVGDNIIVERAKP
jgi:hypothetical protein